jgi:hypothetical protein
MRRLIHFEGKHQPLLATTLYYNRLLRNLAVGAAVILLFLGIGILGYHHTCQFSWLDSLLNASMILSGMGPTAPITTDAGKWFASVYALVSGIVFITTIGIILAPIAHRIFHRFHLEDTA